MKKYMRPLIFAAIIIFTACNTERDKEIAKNKELNYRLDSLSTAIDKRDSTVNDLLSSFNEIEQNLDSVAAKQNVIALNIDKQKEDLKGSAKNRINYQISAINALMDQNHKKISELNRQLKNSTIKIGQFQKMVASLNEELAQKNTELQSLNEKLVAANAQVTQLQTSVDTLSNLNNSKSQIIADQTNSIHTAYYVIGKSKDLEKINVIDKTGGLLGIGKTSKLKSDFNPNNFTRIDYTKVVTIPINSKKAKVITAHPTDSYSLDKEGDQITSLHVTQPEKFWGASKFLVVVNN